MARRHRRLLAAPIAPAVRALLAPYLDVRIAAFNARGDALDQIYPGSPALLARACCAARIG